MKQVEQLLDLIPSIFFSSPPVVLLSFISRFAVVRQQIDSDTTGSEKKNWTGHAVCYRSLSLFTTLEASNNNNNNNNKPTTHSAYNCRHYFHFLIFFHDPVELGLIFYHATAKRLIYESNTTGGLKKDWMGTLNGLLFF